MTPKQNKMTFSQQKKKGIDDLINDVFPSFEGGSTRGGRIATLYSFADSIRESVLEENNKDWILFIKRQEELGSIPKSFSEAIDLLNINDQKK